MMNSTLKPFQKDRVKQFMAVTNSPEKSALKFLKETEWDVERAIDRFYSEGASVPKSAVNASKINALFDKYKEADEDEIQVDGTLALCSDLEVDPQDVVVLVLAWHLGCQRMGEFKRKGWVDGWTQLRCDTIEAMKDSLVTMRTELQDRDKFKEIYQFTFNFALQDMQKSLPLDVAIPFWELLLTDRFQHLNLWATFLREKHGKAISRDTWNQFLDFIRSAESDENFDKHDIDGAWPVLIDNFVEYAREEMGLPALSS